LRVGWRLGDLGWLIGWLIGWNKDLPFGAVREKNQANLLFGRKVNAVHKERMILCRKEYVPQCLTDFSETSRWQTRHQ